MSISISGLVTGLDSSTIISQLMQLERAPETIMQATQQKYQNQISEFQKIETALKSFQTTLKEFNTADNFKSMQTTVADSSVLTASSSSSATPGIHTVEVTALAKNQRQVSTGVASQTDNIFNTGSFTITDSSGNATTVTIDEGDNSLEGIVSAINASGANVTASIINDGSSTPYRLVVTGKDTDNYTLDFSGLTTAPEGGTGSLVPTMLGESDPSYQAGTAATLVVDGITMTKTSNTVTDAIQGVTLNLLKEGSTTTVSVANDTSAVTNKINAFISSYNEVINLVNAQSAYDADTDTAGVLSGDSTVRTIQSRLQSLLSTTVSGVTGPFTSLASLGITSDKSDGTLSIDSTTLSTALSENFEAVADLFTHNTGTSTTLASNEYGIAQQFNLAIESMVSSYVGSGSSSNGLIETRINGLTTSISDIDDQIDSLESRIEKMQTNLERQFSTMETTVSTLQTQGNILLTYLSSLS